MIVIIIARLYPPARHKLLVCVKRLRVLPGALRQRLYNYQRLRVFYGSVTFAFRQPQRSLPTAPVNHTKNTKNACC